MSNDPLDITISMNDPDGQRLTLTIPWDSNAETMVDTFRTIMFWLTFSPSLIEEYLPTEDEKINENQN